MNFKTIEKKVKNFVEDECKKPSSNYGYDPFIFHIIPVVNYAKKLADKFGADKEIVILSAWLHDIGSFMCGRENHHLTGAKIAAEKLKEFGYPENKIKQVADCILTHRGSQKLPPKTIEGQILAEADAMSAFNDIAGLFQCAFVYEKLPRIEAKKSVKQKLQNKWNQLKLTGSKEMVKANYKAAILLLK